MHDLVEKVKVTLKEQFRDQLASAIHTKFQTQNVTVNENIKKLEDYLAKVTPELNLLRNQGNHLVLAK
jgi:dynactin complex subunit